MQFFWKNNWSADSAIFILLFIITSLSAFQIQWIEGIEGDVTEMEFDTQNNVYGIEGVTKFKNFKISFHYPFISLSNDATSLFFKLNANKELIWKIRCSHSILTADITWLFPLGETKEFLANTKILINHQNEVYLVVEKEKIIKIYTPWVNSRGIAILKKVSELRPLIVTRDNDELQYFIVDDNIIVAGYLDEDMPSRSTIKVLKVKSGKWLTVASSKKKALITVQDKEGNIYFTGEDGGCESYLCEVHKPGEQKIYVLTSDSLKKDSPKPRIIDGVTNSKKVTGLLVNGDKNEIYLQTSEPYSFDVDYLEIVDDMLTFFAKSKTITVLKNVKNEKVTQETFSENWDLEANETILILHHYIDLSDFSENNTLVPISSQMVPLVADEKDYYSFLKVILRLTAVFDKEGNMIFDYRRNYYSENQFLFVNRTTQEVQNITLEPELLLRNYNSDMLIDEKDGVWILPYGWYMKDRVKKDLYYLEKGSSIAKKIFEYKNIEIIRKNKKDEIFIATSSGLFFIN